jgi:vacuolar protein sorting-associated protein 35
MDRLANYYAEEELLDEADTNQVKLSMARDSFYRFEGCVQNVYNARGPKLTPKEVVRLQTALLNFSLKCYPGNMEQVNRCLLVCKSALDQARMGIPEEGTAAAPMKELDEAAVTELGKLLSIPLDSLALKVLELDHYSDLLAHLPWENRREVGVSMLKSVIASGVSPRTVKEMDELFAIIAPVIRDEHMPPPPSQEHVDRTSDLMKDLGITVGRATSFGPGDAGTMGSGGSPEENLLVSKLVHLLNHEDTDMAYEMLVVARKHLYTGGKARIANTMVPLVFAALQLADRIYALEHGVADSEESKEDTQKTDQETTESAVEDEPGKDETPEESKAVDKGAEEGSGAESTKDKTADEAEAPESAKPTTEGAEQLEAPPETPAAVEEPAAPTKSAERSVRYAYFILLFCLRSPFEYLLTISRLFAAVTKCLSSYRKLLPCFRRATRR